jgi:hypothetical protein
MNYLLTAPCGSVHDVSAAEAAAHEAAVRRKRDATKGRERRYFDGLLADVQIAQRPEWQYAEVYAPRDYVPGWTPDP